MNNFTALFRFITSPYEKEGVYISSMKSKTMTYEMIKSKVARLNSGLAIYSAFEKFTKEYYENSLDKDNTYNESEDTQKNGIDKK